jgi:hypothetical protein
MIELAILIRILRILERVNSITHIRQKAGGYGVVVDAPKTSVFPKVAAHSMPTSGGSAGVPVKPLDAAASVSSAAESSREVQPNLAA